MLSVPMTWVKEGGMVRLDKKYLQTDYKGVSSDDVVYTIHAADGQPKYGNKSNTLSHVVQVHIYVRAVMKWGEWQDMLFNCNPVSVISAGHC